jgi:hypothetical protein
MVIHNNEDNFATHRYSLLVSVSSPHPNNIYKRRLKQWFAVLTAVIIAAPWFNHPWHCLCVLRSKSRLRQKIAVVVRSRFQLQINFPNLFPMKFNSLRIHIPHATQINRSFIKRNFALNGNIFTSRDYHSIPWLNGNMASAEKCSGPLRFRRQILLYFGSKVPSSIHKGSKLS